MNFMNQNLTVLIFSVFRKAWLSLGLAGTLGIFEGNDSFFWKPAKEGGG